MKGLRLPAAERSDARPRKKKKKGTKMNKNENSLIIIDGTRPGHETGMGGCYRKTFVLHRDPETNELCISQRISAGEIAAMGIFIFLLLALALFIVKESSKY